MNSQETADLTTRHSLPIYGDNFKTMCVKQIASKLHLNSITYQLEFELSSDSFQDLVRSAVVRDDEQLKITSALSFNNLLRVACVKEEEREARFPATSLGAACTPQDAAHYLQWFKSQLKTDPALRDVYLFALGNSASPTVMASLRAAALDKTYKTGVRATAVLAMKELMVRDANATVPTLLHLYQDSTQPLPVRLAAAALLVFSRSSPVVWQRLAMSTWFERSPAICAFVWSSLSTLAQTRDPVLKPM